MATEKMCEPEKTAFQSQSNALIRSDLADSGLPLEGDIIAWPHDTPLIFDLLKTDMHLPVTSHIWQDPDTIRTLQIYTKHHQYLAREAITNPFSFGSKGTSRAQLVLNAEISKKVDFIKTIWQQVKYFQELMAILVIKRDRNEKELLMRKLDRKETGVDVVEKQKKREILRKKVADYQKK
jgi:hypothetical protein